MVLNGDVPECMPAGPLIDELTCACEEAPAVPAVDAAPPVGATVLGVDAPPAPAKESTAVEIDKAAIDVIAEAVILGQDVTVGQADDGNLVVVIVGPVVDIDLKQTNDQIEQVFGGDKGDPLLPAPELDISIDGEKVTIITTIDTGDINVSVGQNGDGNVVIITTGSKLEELDTENIQEIVDNVKEMLEMERLRQVAEAIRTAIDTLDVFDLIKDDAS